MFAHCIKGVPGTGRSKSGSGQGGQAGAAAACWRRARCLACAARAAAALCCEHSGRRRSRQLADSPQGLPAAGAPAAAAAATAGQAAARHRASLRRRRAASWPVAPFSASRQMSPAHITLVKRSCCMQSTHRNRERLARAQARPPGAGACAAWPSMAQHPACIVSPFHGAAATVCLDLCELHQASTGACSRLVPECSAWDLRFQQPKLGESSLRCGRRVAYTPCCSALGSVR